MGTTATQENINVYSNGPLTVQLMMESYSGTAYLQADFTSITYSVLKAKTYTTSDFNTQTGLTDIAVDIPSSVFDTLQTNPEGNEYNFEFILPQSPIAMADRNTTYLLRLDFTFTDGSKTVWECVCKTL